MGIYPQTYQQPTKDTLDTLEGLYQAFSVCLYSAEFPDQNPQEEAKSAGSSVQAHGEHHWAYESRHQQAHI